MLSWLNIGIGATLGALLAFGPAFFYGKSVGKADLVVSLQEDRAKIVKDGKQIDESVYSADDSSLCVLLGGCLSNDAESHKPM
jgi:hypothetical protein